MNAKVFVETKEPGPIIDPKLFGHFIENMGRGIYQGGLISSDGRIRTEIIDALKGMKVSVLRWPGGLFADGYHWQDGIGKDRPVRPNIYWKRLGPLMGPKDPNYFGTHEFLDLCDRLDAEPYLNVNLGSGTPEEAASWVQYCNGSQESRWGKVRSSNNRLNPWNVKIWGIGNEIFGWWSIGHTDPFAYSKKYLEFYEAMMSEDQSIKPVLVGTCDLWPDWNPIVLTQTAGKASYLSFHVYLPGNEPKYLFMAVPGTASNHYSLASAYFELDRKIRFVSDQIRYVLGKDSGLKIALDEWNLWWWWPQAYKVWWKMRDAISLAGMAGVLVEHCEDVEMSNLAQAINVLGLLNTNYRQVVATPLYYVMQMFASTMIGRRLKCKVDVSTYQSKKLGGIPAQNAAPFVSAHAAVEGSGVGIILVQRNYNGPVTIEIESPGVVFDKVSILSGPSPEAKNTFANPKLVRIYDSAPKECKGGLTLHLPAACVAAVKGDLTA